MLKIKNLFEVLDPPSVKKGEEKTIKNELKAEKYHFKFIDLFAGIGGFHLAMHNLGGECVFASEMDPHARSTYQENFKNISPNLFSNGFFILP